MRGLYTCLRRVVGLLLALLPLVVGAQSGPYGNEWISSDPNQAYYKIQVTQDGIYRLDHAYLTRAGLGASTNPQRVQLWRRGQQVALYGGGNQNQLDATTYFEFYGQRNDGRLDQQMYKLPAEQPHPLYSLFSDTAAYFLTVAPTTNGRRMTDVVTPTTATLHRSWLHPRLRLLTDAYNFGQTDTHDLTFYPWADKGEGFLSPDIRGADTLVVDSLFRRSVTGGAQAWVETVLVGAHTDNHSTNIAALPGGRLRVPARPLHLAPIAYGAYQNRRVVLPLQPSDFGSNGRIGFRFGRAGTANNDVFCVGYIRVVNPQTAHWPAGRRAISFWNDSTLAGAAYYQLDSIPAAVVGYDVTDPANVRRSAGLALGGQRRAYGFAGTIATTRRLLLFDGSRALTPAPAQRLTFRPLNPSGPNFIIVTSRALKQRVGNVPDPVLAYATYRATAGPGHLAYDTLVVTSEQLYDQFHYGERSPLALRHFAQYMLTGTRSGQYLLLLGKGTLISENGSGLSTYYRQASAAERAMSPDWVPASTRGASDVFFTADWQNDVYVPRMVTGRVAARTPAQVLDYLAKLQSHEVPTPAAWRKNILHMAGGILPNEQRAFREYLRGYGRVAKRPFFGAQVDTLVNTASTQTTVDITPQINAGLGLITYFGHGSNSTIDLTPTDITQSSSNYANAGRYPVFFGVGCSIGSSFGAYGSMGENLVMTPNKGLVGLLADTDFGTDIDQHLFAERMYQLLFRDAAWYGKPVAAVQREALRQIQTTLPSIPASGTGAAMMTNITWHGDPALALFSPDRPDYQFTPGTSVQIEPAAVLASTPRFNLRLRLSNYGKIEPVRRIRIAVERLVNGTPLPGTEVFIPYFLRDTTVVVPMTNPLSPSVFGSNTFTVKIDDPNLIPELDENNNTATFTYNFLNGGITLLNPTEYGIVGRAGVRLVGQSNMVQPQPVRYEFQLDTIPTFAQPIAQAIVTARDLATWTPNLPPPVPGRDSLVYYWRLRFEPTTAAPGMDVSWVSSSFRFISNSPGGWSQSHYGQMAGNAKTRLTQATPGGRWSFAERTRTLQLQTKGGPSDHVRQATFLNTYGLTVDGSLIAGNNCGQPGLSPDPRTISPSNIIAAVFDGPSLRQLNTIPGGNYNRCGDVGRATYFHFASTFNLADSLQADNVNTTRRQGQLLAFLQNVPNGAYVALISMNRVNFASFRPDLKAQLAAMGSSLINTAQDGDPLLMVLRKGFPAQAQETTFSPGSSTPRDSQVVTLNYVLRTNEASGTLTSTRIGPAQQWQTLYHTIKQPDGAADSYTLRLIGYDRNNNRVPLNPNVTGTTTGSTTAYSLSGVDATTYPYLQLELELRDSVNRTPPQLKQWLVTYQGVPEGVVRRDHPSIPTDAYAATTLSAAASSTGVLNIPVYFENVAPVDFAGLAQAKAYVTEVSSGRVETVTIPATRLTGFSRRPGADSTAVYNFSLNVAAMSGELGVRLVANSGELPELTTINNELNLTLTAPTVTLAPVLDVAFDGIHILNGDIVSPRPEIVVDVKYEDKRRPLTDSTRIELFLTHPRIANQPVVVQQIDMADIDHVHFDKDVAAGRSRVTYRPEKLADGVYTLQAQARDMAGTVVAARRYSVTFEVINQASITNVFPYPNPVTSKARFVFTLTGSTPPRNMKIQILTLSGKVVKEITQAELGNVHVGNNLTDYAWDGTDSYGDRLANGTYLYRVLLDDPGSEYEHRRTAADQAFKKGWGKLVLLR